jgi:ribosomal protein L11 methyltransferase
MATVEVEIRLHPLDPFRDLLVFYLEQEGFSGFEYTESGLNAYTDESAFSPETLQERLRMLSGKAEYQVETRTLPDTNWNEAWEQNFSPVVINPRIRIRAPFHDSDPSFPIELVIAPKMSFGTGHHATTSLMADSMEQLDLAGKKVLDMGSGTGLLAILAVKLNASECVAIDNDPWCYQNAQENVEMNGCPGIKVLLGDASALPGLEYDVILANINRNILLADMAAYVKALLPAGLLVMSGFYTEDLPAISAMAESLDMEPMFHRSRENWVVAAFKKK